MNKSGILISQLTPPGRGAVASILVSGPDAIERVSRHFSPASEKSLLDLPAGRVVFGSFRSLADAAEEVVVGLHLGNHVEIHCHGGPLAAAAVMKTLTGGGEEAAWQQVAERSNADRIAAEARVALAGARTERTALILLDQFHGSLRNFANDLANAIGSQPDDSQKSLARIDRLWNLAPLGRHLTEPWRVLIAGPPNVGKSSLMNALVGYQRSIVFGEPGTTRDLLSAVTVLDGWPVELVDSAGLRDSTDSLEAAGIARAEAGLAAADLVLWVQDASVQSVNRVARPRLHVGVNAIVINNKVDLVPDYAKSHPADAVAVSALTGFGMEELCARIAQHLVPNPPARGEAMLFTVRQVQIVSEATAALRAGRTLQALDRLRSL